MVKSKKNKKQSATVRKVPSVHSESVQSEHGMAVIAFCLFLVGFFILLAELFF